MSAVERGRNEIGAEVPARDQSRIWQVAGMVAHGRGIGPFEVCAESMVPGGEIQVKPIELGVLLSVTGCG